VIDADVESTLDAAVRFALAGLKPDPAEACDYVYASGLRTRPGVTASPAERTVPR
jgi:acetoin:2,6-dichlorophenolindophenol oxidoreductase subunit alpha